MILYLKNIHIKDKSWRSFFTTEKVILSIIERNGDNVCNHSILTLKCKNTTINYFHFYDEQNTLTLNILRGGKIMHSFHIKGNIGKLFVESSSLKVHLQCIIFSRDTFLFLENKERSMKHMEEL